MNIFNSFYSFFYILTPIGLLIAYFLHRRQNQEGKLGGKISSAKSLWLFYTIYTWFLLIPLVHWTSPHFLSPINQDLIFSWLIFSLLMWLRGLIEMVMLFITKNWTPPIGITHDIICLFWLIIYSFYKFQSIFIETFSLIPTLFHFSLILSLCFETYYAYAFFKIVKEKTKGDEGIWYASEEDKKFRTILRVTKIGNTILCSLLAIFIYHLFTLLP